MRVSANFGCGCLLVGAGLIYLASRLLGPKGMLFVAVVFVGASVLLGVYAASMVKRQARMFKDALRPPTEGPPGEQPKHTLWVCDACGESNAPGTPCRGCGKSE